MQVELVPCGPTTNESERTAIDKLKTGLISEPGQEKWILLTNLSFSSSPHRQSDEIDIVVIGPTGVTLIEVKHWSASWVRRNIDIVEVEAERVTRKARTIGTTLRHKVASLPLVNGVFLVTETASKVADLLHHDAVRGVPFFTYKSWRSALNIESKHILDSKQIKTLCYALEPRSSVIVEGSISRIGGYGHMKLLSNPEEKFHRMFSARHTSRQDRVILHLYDLSASNGVNTEAQAAREWRALLQLQQFQWAPRIVDSFQHAFGYPGELKFFSVSDHTAPTIRERSKDTSWSILERLEFATRAIQALAEFHEKSGDGDFLVHRNLTAQTILVRYDNSPILTGFKYTKIPEEHTVAVVQTSENWHTETSPEVRTSGLGAADHRSDVYSLCKSLSILFNDSDQNWGSEACRILSRGTQENPTRRICLKELLECMNGITGEKEQEFNPPSARYWTEDQIISFRNNDYRIVSRLGSGGVGITFKVVKIDPVSQSDAGTYVAKVCLDEEKGKQVLSAYGLAHSHLRHSSLSTIFEIAQDWQDNNFVALMTWVEGKPLSEFSGMFPTLVEDSKQDSNESLAISWLRSVCEALNVLHDNGLVHGDVSPGNLIVCPNGQLVVTDYDCVCQIGQNATRPGTVAYSSPVFDKGLDVSASDDLFSLAASFFRVIFDREPFMYDGNRLKGKGLNWDELDRENYPNLTRFLDTATHPQRGNRYTSASLALKDLIVKTPQIIDTTHVDEFDYSTTSLIDTEGQPKSREFDTPSRTPNEVKWLKNLLQAYPGSTWGNSETRGLDSEFAEQTYVETDLERTLYSAIVNKPPKLIVLCGNAGDGKTALLQRLGRKLGLVDPKSDRRILAGTHNGTSVRINLDGSAAWEDQTSDQLLKKLLSPFHQGRPDQPIAHCLAINDGRLLEWIEVVEETIGQTSLTKSLKKALLGPKFELPAHILFVNLNNRSVVGSVSSDRTSITTQFMDSLIDRLYGGENAEEIWNRCSSCSAQNRCEILRATQTFGPGKLSEANIRIRSRERLFEAFQAVHLRGETHITIRELRASLVYILFGTNYCSDYHSDESKKHANSFLPYWDRAFSPLSLSRQGDVLNEFLRFDPALDANPKIDRFLLREDFNFTNSIPKLHTLEHSLSSLRRFAYFHWSEDKVVQVSGQRDSLGLAQGKHLKTFKQIATSGREDDHSTLKHALCGGISRLEALPLIALKRDNVVPLRIAPRTPTETAIWIEKSIDDFEIKANIAFEVSNLDQLHRQVILIYKYRDGAEEKLYLGADLFHLLLDLNDGYQLGDVATDDAFANLSIFVQRIVRENERRLFAWNPINHSAAYEIYVVEHDAVSDFTQTIRICPTHNLEDCNGS